MRFSGEGKVWDATYNRVLCQFKDGFYDTTDERTKSILLKSYQVLDGTKKEIIDLLESRQIEFDRTNKKADLMRLLWAKQDEQKY